MGTWTAHGGHPVWLVTFLSLGCSTTTTTSSNDLGVGDMHVEGDMPEKQDLLMPPDLTPYCTVASVATSCPSPAAAICDTTLPVAMCRACTSSADDSQCAAHSSATPHCNSSSGQCVQCNMNTDCAASATTPICDSGSNTCRACKIHSDCSSGVCIFDGASTGACAPTAQVALVNNRGTTVSACELAHTTRNGTTAATAYCDVSEAVTAASPQPYALIAGSAQPYGAITLSTSRTLTIVGPGKSPGQSPTALLFTATLSPAVTVSPTAGQTITLILDGLELSGSSGTANQRAGVLCNGATGTAATVTVRNCVLDNSGTSGIDSTSCDLSIDANNIGPSNANGGIKLASTTYKITNNLIFENGDTVNATVAGVVFDDTSPDGVFAFNTVAGNKVKGNNPGGVKCGANNNTIKDSVVSHNVMTTTPTTTQLAGCTFANVVTEATDAQGIMSTPSFVSLGADYRLVAGAAANLTCCIDKAANPGTPNNTHDVDETVRPKGISSTPYDYGAQEVQ